MPDLAHAEQGSASDAFAPARTSPTRTAAGLKRALITDDADQLARSINGWSQNYEQLRCGSFQGSLCELSFGDTRVFLEQTSHALRQHCIVPAGYVWFGLARSKDRCVRINGSAVDSGRIAVHRGGTNFELLTPDALQFFGIVVKEDVLLDHAQQFGCADGLSAALERPVLAVSEARKHTVQTDCYNILHHASPVKDSSASSPLNRSLAEHTLNALFFLLESSQTVGADRNACRQRHRLIEGADAYVRAHRDRLVTVAELCSALSTSRRALQVGFQEILGVAPHAYIRAVSLNGVRRHLKDPASPYDTVQEAAAAYGFWHMSQFAGDYRQLFGELPSETLKRRTLAGQPST